MKCIFVYTFQVGMQFGRCAAWSGWTNSFSGAKFTHLLSDTSNKTLEKQRERERKTKRISAFISCNLFSIIIYQRFPWCRVLLAGATGSFLMPRVLNFAKRDWLMIGNKSISSFVLEHVKFFFFSIVTCWCFAIDVILEIFNIQKCLLFIGYDKDVAVKWLYRKISLTRSNFSNIIFVIMTKISNRIFKRYVSQFESDNEAISTFYSILI